MTRRLLATGRRDDSARTGTCTACHAPVTATQSALDWRTPTGRRTLTHYLATDCARSVKA